jgi:anion-transporting  ArsA/GET3 family ATPase
MSNIDRLYVLCFTVLSALGIGYLITHPAPRPDTLAMARQVDSLQQAADSAKTVAIQAQYAAKAAGQQERQAATRLMHQLRATRDSLAHLRHLPLDTSASADTLRTALAVALSMADTLAERADAYLAEVDSLRDRYAEERRAMTVALDKMEHVAANQDALIRALQKKAECRIAGLPCPSRPVLFVAGFVTGLLLTR